MLVLYLITLFLAPQLWVGGLDGFPVDYVVYPIWLFIAISKNRFLPRGLQHWDIAFLLFLFWLFATTVVNGFQSGSGSASGPSGSVDFLISYVKWFVLFQLVLGHVRDLKTAKRVGVILIVFGIILAIESFQQKALGVGWAGQKLAWVDPSVLAAGGTGRTRWIGIFDGPGVFCVIFTNALPFALQYLSPRQGFARKIFGAATTAVLLVAIFLTGSRGGFLATLTILGLYLTFRYKVSISKVAMGAAVGAVLFAAAPSSLTTMRDESNSANYRVEMWAEGIQMAAQNPVFGIGRGNFSSYTGFLIAHNSAIEMMGELGLVGFLFWAALIYLCAKGLIQTYRATKDPRLRAFLVAMGTTLAGYIASSMFVTLEYETFYIILALCAATGTLYGNKVIFTKQDAKVLLGLTAIWLVVLKGFVMSYF